MSDSVKPRSVPSQTLHKPTSQARVRLNGRDIYLGVYGSTDATINYHRVIAEWEASDRTIVPKVDRPGRRSNAPKYAVSELIHAYRHAKERPGSRTWKAAVAPSLRRLRKEFGTTPAAEFTPAKLKLLQRKCAEERDEQGRKLSRGYINGKLIARVRDLFRWGVGEGLVPETTHRALCAVEELKYGEAPDLDPVRPVEQVVVDATLPHLPPIVADMVQVQRFTGARPGEVCRMTWAEIDTVGAEIKGASVWLYTPKHHKTAHRGRRRTIAIGPRAQAMLMKYRHRPATLPLFSPAESEAKRHASLRLARQTPLSTNQTRDMEREANPKRQYRDAYTTDAYGLAIRRACARAFPAPANSTVRERAEWDRKHAWAPNQLRHAAGTAIRRQLGLEAASAVMGHADLDTTLIYAEKEQELAAKTAALVG